MKQTHGGARPNSGRKKGSGKGRIAINSSITLRPEQWAKLDSVRKGMTRSRWIAERIAKAKVKAQADL